MEVTATLPSRSGGIASVIGQLRAERLRLARMRVSFAGVAFLVLLLIAWLLPWVPFGMAASDYTAGAAGALVLGGVAALAAIAFVAVWAPFFRTERLPEFLRVLLGGHQLIRGRAQFFGRLAAECRRAHRDRRYVFSIVIVERPEGARPTPEWLEPRYEHDPAAMLVRSVVRSEDVVASSDGELWVLLAAAGPVPCHLVAERLARTLTDGEAAGALPEGYRIGGSTFGEDGQDTDALVAVARARMRPALRSTGPSGAA